MRHSHTTRCSAFTANNCLPSEEKKTRAVIETFAGGLAPIAAENSALPSASDRTSTTFVAESSVATTISVGLATAIIGASGNTTSRCHKPVAASTRDSFDVNVVRVTVPSPPKTGRVITEPCKARMVFESEAIERRETICGGMGLMRRNSVRSSIDHICHMLPSPVTYHFPLGLKAVAPTVPPVNAPA